MLSLTVMLCSPELLAQDSYYKDPNAQIFNPYPNDVGRDAGKAWRIRYFGPVGIGLDLKRPGMTMEIVNIEEDSPADKTNKLKPGQIIESINGIVLKDTDPRIILGDIITQAEATDGKINLKIQGERDVLVEIPVMGSYSETWPVNCPKSDKIVRNLADLIAKQETPSWGSVLFMLSTGEEQDLKVVSKWMKGIETIGEMNWEKGYKGIGLCEYYLRTGDPDMLPVISKMADELKENMYNGGWSGRGKPAAFTYSTGTGQVHASGMHCLTFVLMAKLCGAEVDDYMLNEALTQFYRFAGHGNVAYGNGAPEGGFRDNGKTSGLAVAMAVAAQISPEGESSVYAKARDNSATKAFYATNWFHAAHTGGGMGEIWHHGAVALMREKRPSHYRSYHDTRRWVMDLSRRHDGSIAIEGMDDRYNRSLTDAEGGRDWGTYFALTYTYPRKALQIWGAPRSEFAKHFELPKHPWGNAADDVFQLNEPIEGGEKVRLTMEDLLREDVENSASLAVIHKMEDPATTEAEILQYVLHPENEYRAGAMNQVVQRGFVHLIVPFMESEDPRLRQAGLLAITGMFKGKSLSNEQLTPEMFDLVGQMIENPEESWWVALHAIKALGRADTERIAKHRDRLLAFLEYDCDWLQSESIIVLSKIAVQPDHYKKVLPLIIDKASAIRVDSSSYNATNAIKAAVQSASPEVKEFANPLLEKNYLAIKGELADPYTGAIMKMGAKTIRTRIGSIIQLVPGGMDFMRQTPKTTLESYISDDEEDMYVYDGKFKPNKEMLGTWHWAVHPIPMKPEQIDPVVKAWLKNQLKDGSINLGTPKDILTIEEGGKVSQSRYYPNYFWTDGLIIGVDDAKALKAEVRTYKGIDFLIIETGSFGDNPTDDLTKEVPKDFHCGYFVYMRAQ